MPLPTGVRRGLRRSSGHGLRAAEVTDLKWEQIDFDRGELHVNRLKGGTESTHP